MYVDFDIRHDDWCPILTQPDKVAAKLHEACECKADITFELSGKRYGVSQNGNVFEIGGRPTDANSKKENGYQ